MIESKEIVGRSPGNSTQSQGRNGSDPQVFSAASRGRGGTLEARNRLRKRTGALQLARGKNLNTFPITGKESFRKAFHIESFDANHKKEFLLPAPGRSRLKISYSSRPVHG
jgi:hypothetical protein